MTEYVETAYDRPDSRETKVLSSDEGGTLTEATCHVDAAVPTTSKVSVPDSCGEFKDVGDSSYATCHVGFFDHTVVKPTDKPSSG